MSSLHHLDILNTVALEDDDDVELEICDTPGEAVPFLEPPRKTTNRRPLFFNSNSTTVEPVVDPTNSNGTAAHCAHISINESIQPCAAEEDKTVLETHLEELLSPQPKGLDGTLPVCSYVLRRYLNVAAGAFRPRQQDVCLSVLQGKNTLAVCPTGWGKSLCYQFPMAVHRQLFNMRYRQWEEEVQERITAANVTMAPPPRAQSKFCLVISPLLSLMADQADKVNKTGSLQAVVLSSQISGQREENLLRSIASPTSPIDIVFVSPEKLIGHTALRELLEGQHHRLALVCVDEVHCVSKWAYDFRPSFMYVNRILKDLVERAGKQNQNVNRTSFLCLTATASKSVMSDLQRMFSIEHTVSCMDVLRQNLILDSVDMLEKTAAFTGAAGSHKGGPPSSRVVQDALLAAVDELPKPIIVYVQSRAEADELSSLLASKLGNNSSSINDDGTNGGNDRGTFRKYTTAGAPTRGNRTSITVRCYHAALSRHMRTITQQQFLRGDIDVLVATVAFGMGIDKANIRGVIHASAPSSLEAYAQEIGRAGRDGLTSHCRLLYNPFDYYDLRSRLLSSMLSPAEVEAIVSRLLSNPIAQHGERHMLISTQKISEELLVAEETVETILFMMLTSDDVLLKDAFDGVHGVCPLGYRVQSVRGDDGEDANEGNNNNNNGNTFAPQSRKRSRASNAASLASSGAGVGSILAQLQAHDGVLDVFSRNKIVPNLIEAANDAKLSWREFTFRVKDLVTSGTVKLGRVSSAFLVECGEDFSRVVCPTGQKTVAKHLFDIYVDRLQMQIDSLSTMFAVLQHPSHSGIQRGLDENKDTQTAHHWEPPQRTLKKMEAVSIANDFVEKNHLRINSSYEAARCLLGVMPRSVIKHGKYAGQLPLSLSWYVGSPYFGTLKEFDMAWVLAVLTPHNLDAVKESH